MSSPGCISPAIVAERGAGGGGGVSPEAQAVLDRYIGLTGTETDAIVAFVDAEVSDGNWDTYDEFFLFPLGATNGLIGFKSVTGTIVNDPTFDIGGLLFNGTTQYFDTTIDPSTDLTQASLNDIDIQCFCKDNLSTDSNDYLHGCRSGSSELSNYQGPSSIRARVNTAFIVTQYDGQPEFQDENLYGIGRDESVNAEIFVDGIEVRTEADASNGFPDEPIYIGARSPVAAFLNCKVATFKIGAAIGFNQADHNTNLRTMLTTLGTI